MPTQELTDAWVRSVKPTPEERYEEYWDTKLKGFGCRVLSDGTKTWNVAAWRGKERLRGTLGNYPTVRLGDARGRARAIIQAFKEGRSDHAKALLSRTQQILPEMAGGQNTSPRARSAENAPAQTTTIPLVPDPPAGPGSDVNLLFGLLATRYLEEYSKIYKGSWRQDIERYHRVLKVWENVPVAHIHTETVLDLLRPFRATPAEHDQIKSLISVIFKWGMAENLVFRNPAAGLSTAQTSKLKRQRMVRQRAYTESEIRNIFKALDQMPFVEGAYFKFGFYTAQRLGSNMRSAEESMGDKELHGTAVRNSLTPEQRKKRGKLNPQSDDRGEILYMEWSEIDWDTAWWTCPGQRTKNGLPNRVPLAPEAVRLLRDVQADQKKRGINSRYVWIFNEARRFPRWAQKLAQAAGVQIERRPPVYARKQALRIRALSGVKDFSQHCVRHTCTTHMTASGVDEYDVAKLLSHVTNDKNRNPTSVYNHYRYDIEKRDMIDFWLVKLRMILNEQSTAALHFKTFSMQRWIERQKAEEARLASAASNGAAAPSTP